MEAAQLGPPATNRRNADGLSTSYFACMSAAAAIAADLTTFCHRSGKARQLSRLMKNSAPSYPPKRTGNNSTARCERSRASRRPPGRPIPPHPACRAPARYKCRRRQAAAAPSQGVAGRCRQVSADPHLEPLEISDAPHFLTEPASHLRAGVAGRQVKHVEAGKRTRLEVDAAALIKPCIRLAGVQAKRNAGARMRKPDPFPCKRVTPGCPISTVPCFTPSTICKGGMISPAAKTCTPNRPSLASLTAREKKSQAP